MAMLARTPQQVIAAEATYRGDINTRFQDMLGIASVINNRAIATGTTPQQVVGVNSQFNSYNKAMPPGSAAYIDLANNAWNEVLTNGSITSATYFATPAAASNLPNGLEQVDAIDGGHVYYSDPNARAIKTAVGFRAPNLTAVDDAIATAVQKYQAMVPDVASVPTPLDRPVVDPGSLASALTATDQTNQTPFDAVTPANNQQPDLAKNGLLSAIFSSEPPAVNNFADLAAAGPMAAPVTATPSATLGAAPDLSASAMANVASALNAPASAPASSGWSDMAEAGPMGGYPADPTSAARMGNPALNSFAPVSFAAPVAAPMNVTATAASPTSPGLAAAMSAPAIDANQSLSNMAQGMQAQRDYTAAPTDQAPADQAQTSNFDTSRFNDPNFSLSADQQSVANAMQNTPDAANAFQSEVASEPTHRVTPEDQARIDAITADPNASLTAPVTSTLTSTSPVVTSTQTLAPALTTVSIPDQPSVQAATPTHTAMDVWSGNATTGIATDGSTVSKMPDGTIGRYNPEYDHTEFTNPDGSYGGMKPGNALTGAAAQPSTPSNPTTTSSAISANSSLNSGLSRISDSVFSGGTFGAIAGAALGSALAGPLGGLALGMVGRQLGGRYLGDKVPDESPIHSLLGLFTGQPTMKNGFPSAPYSSNPGGHGVGYGGLNDYGKDVYGGSGQFSGAIDNGGVGLF